MKKRLLLLMMTLVLAAGMLLNQAGEPADDPSFRPEMIEGCTFAELHHRATGQQVHQNSEYDLNNLVSLLVCAEEMVKKPIAPLMPNWPFIWRTARPSASDRHRRLQHLPGQRPGLRLRPQPLRPQGGRAGKYGAVQPVWGGCTG